MIKVNVKGGRPVLVEPRGFTQDDESAAAIAAAIHHALRHPPGGNGEILSVETSAGVVVYRESQGGTAPTPEAARWGLAIDDQATRHEDRDPRGVRELKRDEIVFSLERVAAQPVAVTEPARDVGATSIVYRAPEAVVRAVKRAPRSVRVTAAVGAVTIGAVPVATGTVHAWLSGAAVLLATEEAQAMLDWLGALIGG